MGYDKKAPYVHHYLHDVLKKSKKNWISFFNLAKIPFVDIDAEFDINFFDDTMADFYFPKIDLGWHFGETGDFFGVLNYHPNLFEQYPFYSRNLRLPINKNLKYLNFFFKNKKPIVFLKPNLNFTPTAIFYPQPNSADLECDIVIPFAYLSSEKYGTFCWAGGDEDFNDDLTIKKIKDKILI